MSTEINPAEDCLKYLHSRNWIELNKILSNNEDANKLAESPTFSIFENNLIDELKKHEEETNEDQLIVASRIFQLHQYEKSTLQLSENVLRRIARYLFDKDPQKVYATILVHDNDAQMFLENYKNEIQNKIDIGRLSASLNIKIGEHGKLKFDKDIFNGSPQEKELFLAARKGLSDFILLPNTALSTIIDSKVCEFLDSSTIKYFYRSTLDLCVVNPRNYMPEIFIELDSSWHDKSNQIKKDQMKDEIFNKAGLKLDRLRKIENKEMIEIFELFIKKNYPNYTSF